MSMLVNPYRLGGRTYAEFQTHIASLATSGARTWTSGMDFTGAGVWRSTASASGLDAMFGSTWQAEFGSNSGTYVRTLVRHGMPSQAAFNAIVSAGTEVCFTTVSVSGPGDLAALNRNGFTSTADTAREDRFRMSQLLFWDTALGKAQQMNPYAGTGPTDYTW